jgi:hypothetical protein
MGITLIPALIDVALALGLSVLVGRRRGAIIGLAMALGVLACGVIAYIGLVASTDSM